MGNLAICISVYSISAAIIVLRLYTKKIIKIYVKLYMCVYIFGCVYAHTNIYVYIYVYDMHYINVHYCVSPNSKYIIIS